MSIFHLNSPSNVTTAPNERPDHRGSYGIEFAFVWISVLIPANSFPRMEVLCSSSVGCVQTLIYLLRRVVTCMLGGKLCTPWFTWQSTSEFILFSITVVVNDCFHRWLYILGYFPKSECILLHAHICEWSPINSLICTSSCSCMLPSLSGFWHSRQVAPLGWRRCLYVLI